MVECTESAKRNILKRVLLASTHIPVDLDVGHNAGLAFPRILAAGHGRLLITFLLMWGLRGYGVETRKK